MNRMATFVPVKLNRRRGRCTTLERRETSISTSAPPSGSAISSLARAFYWLMDEAEHDVWAFMTFPKAHWPQIYSTNPLEWLNAEIKCRTKVVGIFPNDESITRLVGAMMLEQDDEWSLNRRYMQLEGLQSLCDTVPARLSTVTR